jgi:hypothetical protein
MTASLNEKYKNRKLQLKSNMAAAAILDFTLNAAISLLIDRFSPNFDRTCIYRSAMQKTQNRKCSAKFKMAAAAILDFRKKAITRPFMNQFL